MVVSTTDRWSSRKPRWPITSVRRLRLVAERMRLDGLTAVITGAASGIGRAVSVSLARRGCHVALADIDAAGMAETANLARVYGVRVSQHHIDVSDRTAVAHFPDVVAA